MLDVRSQKLEVRSETQVVAILRITFQVSHKGRNIYNIIATLFQEQFPAKFIVSKSNTYCIINELFRIFFTVSML
jgi:hypothetical protein